MAAEIEDRGGAQVHWLVAGRFGLGERGRTLRLTRADFNEVLERTKLSVTAEVPDTIGSGTRRVSLTFTSLKDLTLKHVLKAVPELGALAAKGDEVAKLKDPSVDQLRAIVGEGPLLEAMKRVVEPSAESAPAAKSDGEATGDADAIFEKAKVEKPTAKSAIDMFVRASSTSPRTTTKPTARQLRDMVEEAVWGMAANVLAAKEIRELEHAWRGLRFLSTECPKDAQMEIVLLETDPDHVLVELGKRERGDDIDEPECIFIPHDFETTAGLAELADFAEQELIPIVVGVKPTLFGIEDPQKLPDHFEALSSARNDDVPEWAARWDELRMVEATRWLCAVANPIALYTEGKGAAERLVFGSGVWGVAAMLAQSYRTTGGFARIFGKAGSLRAPASHALPKGPYSDTAAPTQAFYAIAATETLAQNGILGMGAARNSDTLTLAKAPMVRGAKDAVPLPAQILTGRLVRFATWVKAQLPEGCDSKTANDIFMSAASVFLFPGQEAAAHVRAATTNIDGEAHVVVRAAANPAVASIPFEIVFPLPLNWSVPAPESVDMNEFATAKPKGSPADVAQIEPDGDLGRPEGGVGFAGGSVGFDSSLIKKE